MPTQTLHVGPVAIGSGKPLTIIAGPCQAESEELCLTVGRAVRDRCAELGLPYIFKASFDKANRSSIHTDRGPGMEAGLSLLSKVRDKLGVPITTDLHEPTQAQAVGKVVDLIQIPAFLCRQTDLLVAAAETGKPVNVKKGQFMSPAEMKHVVTKLNEAEASGVMLTERGTFFGYHRLVTDFIGVGDMIELDRSAFTDRGPAPVCFDATHSTQLPGSGEQTGGRPERGPMLALAAVAAGVHALFIESHPEPSKAWSDGATQLPLATAASAITQAARLRAAMARD